MRLVACQNCHTQFDVTHVAAKTFPCRCGEQLENEAHIAENGQSVGPFNAAQLSEAVAAGRLRPESLVWSAGMAGWLPASQVPALAALFQSGPPPLPDGA